MRFSTGCWALLFALGTVLPLRAQDDHGAHSDSIALRNDCRLARQVLVHGQPADRHQWALGIMQDCGTDGVDAIAHQLRQNRSAQTRSPALDALANAATMVIDQQIYSAARDVAADVSAGEAARVHALGVWFTQVSGGAIRQYEALVSECKPGGELILGPIVSKSPPTLRPLSSDALSSSAAALAGILAGESNPRVQLAARHVLVAFELRLEEPELFDQR